MALQEIMCSIQSVRIARPGEGSVGHDLIAQNLVCRLARPLFS